MSSSPSKRPATHPTSLRPARPSRAPEPLRRCPVHDLALSSEGTCLRCGGQPRRRAHPQAEPLLTPISARTKLTWALLAACVLGGLLTLSGRPDDDAAVTPRGMSVTPEEGPSRETPTEADRTAERDSAARQRAGQDQTQAAAEALRGARGRVPVVMYSTSWCGACRSARGYLDAHNLAYTEHDVETNAVARAEQLRLNPRGSVPTLSVGGEVMVGFSEPAFEHALDVAAQRQAR